MKKIVVIAIVMAFLSAGVNKATEAEAGGADVIVVLSLIAGAAYGGYYFSRNYDVDVKKKTDLKIEDQSLDLNMQSDSAGEGQRITVALVNYNF